MKDSFEEADLDALPRTSHDCLLLFVKFLFSEDVVAGDLDRFQQFLFMNTEDNFFGEKVTYLSKGRPIDPPRRPVIYATLHQLSKAKFLDELTTDGRTTWRITHYFSELAETLVGSIVEEKNITAVATLTTQPIPASDRFVSIDHNQAEVQEAIENLSELSKAIVGANDLFANAEERVKVSKEIDYIRQYLEQTKVRIRAVYDFVNNNTLLKFLVSQTLSLAVRDNASKVVTALTHLFHHLSSLF